MSGRPQLPHSAADADTGALQRGHASWGEGAGGAKVASSSTGVGARSMAGSAAEVCWSIQRKPARAGLLWGLTARTFSRHIRRSSIVSTTPLSHSQPGSLRSSRSTTCVGVHGQAPCYRPWQRRSLAAISLSLGYRHRGPSSRECANGIRILFLRRKYKANDAECQVALCNHGEIGEMSGRNHTSHGMAGTGNRMQGNWLLPSCQAVARQEAVHNCCRPTLFSPAARVSNRWTASCPH